MKDIDARGFKTPFNSPRDPALPPYHLRNGVKERAEIDAFEAEHRRRLGMGCPHCETMSRTIDALKLEQTALRERIQTLVDENNAVRHELDVLKLWQAAQR